MLQDIAVLTGGTVITDELGAQAGDREHQRPGPGRQGHCRQGRHHHRRRQGRCRAGIKGRIEQIQVEIENTTSDYDKEKLQERLARLAGGVAIIRVGAGTETELKEKKHRVEDAPSATRAAVEEGIVPGGGVALINAIPALDAVEKGLEGDVLTGVKILRKALPRPMRMLAENAGYDGAVIVESVKREQKAKKNKHIGFDVMTDEYVDMIKGRSSTRPRSPAAGWRTLPRSQP